MKKILLATASLFLFTVTAQAQVAPAQAQPQQWQEAQATLPQPEAPTTFSIRQPAPVVIPSQNQIAPPAKSADSMSLMQFNFGM